MLNDLPQELINTIIIYCDINESLSLLLTNNDISKKIDRYLIFIKLQKIIISNDFIGNMVRHNFVFRFTDRIQIAKKSSNNIYLTKLCAEMFDVLCERHKKIAEEFIQYEFDPLDKTINYLLCDGNYKLLEILKKKRKI